MLIKEYRIPLPLTVEEYRIAQLYMIAKKSRDESKGAESGVEILVNEPYENGPGGCGQYTHKVYHIGSHLPGWFKGILPMSRLAVEEKAWNAYPYTKTCFSCPFVQRFSLEIETYYYPDGGHQENVFGLTGSDLRNRSVDVIDVVKDQLFGADYVREEDPRFYVSQKTGRGPISENWLQEYSEECEGREMPLANGKAIMTAYKLCKVDLHFWGMQSKIENYIHSVALRKTMLRAHRQAWTWQDEWFGLTMEDIREIERQTQESLKRKMAGYQEADEEENEVNHARESSTDSLTGPGERGGLAGTESTSSSTSSSHERHIQAHSLGGNNNNNLDNNTHSLLSRTTSSGAIAADSTSANIRVSVSDMSDQPDGAIPSTSTAAVFRTNELSSGSGHNKNNLGLREPSHPKSALQGKRSSSKSALNSPGSNSSKSLELLASWRVETLMTADSGSDTDDEFFDALDQDADARSLTKWSSMDLIPQEGDGGNEDIKEEDEDSIFSQPYLQRLTAEREKVQKGVHSRGSVETSLPGSPTMHHSHSKGLCSSTVLCLVVHAGSALDAAVDLPAKKSDVTTFKGAFESVIRQNYPLMMGRIAMKLVPCPAVCTDALAILSSLSPYSFDVVGSGDSPQMTHESVPLGAIPLLSTAQMEYWDAVGKTAVTANQAHQEFLRSEEGHGFSGQVIFIGDSLGSILAYDALIRSSHATQYMTDDEVPPSPGHGLDGDYLQPTVGSRRRSSSSVSDPGGTKLDFEVSDFFMLGSPLALVLAQRKILSEDKTSQPARPCQQVFNLFHPTDPLASRLEPLLSARFAAIPPINVARYSKYPLGDGQPYHLLECIQCNPHAFADSSSTTATTSGGANLGNLTPNSARRLSEISIQSGMSGLLDAIPLQTINLLTQKWWGNKRIDYALYCPEALANFPTNSLPHLFHASYWESSDAIAFIIRQLVLPETSSSTIHEDKEQVRTFTPSQPREKWMKKRTSVKLKNISANHRANDVIVKEELPQVLKARFMYGPLDVVSLSGERVDIYLMRDPPGGEWVHLSAETTDKNGRIVYTIPADKSCSYGIYPVQMVVRGDHTVVELYLAVVPPSTECVVFSIDGSFTASMSVTGRDPRVRAGAVDVVRHWQELGYVIIYVTGRPDMQQHLVVAWLAQHNFPHGLVSFADGLSTDFLGHKTDYLRNLVQTHELVIHAAYGSSKDIAVYSSLGVPAERIFIVGKVPKKQHQLATILMEGYAAHLNELQAYGGSRPAQGNSRMVIPRGYFSLPGQPMSIQRRKSAKRASSYPVVVKRPVMDDNAASSEAPTSTRALSSRVGKSSFATK